MRLPEVARLKKLSGVFGDILVLSTLVFCVMTNPHKNNPAIPYMLLDPPTEERVTFWKDAMDDIPFDYIASMQTLKSRTILCPTCRAPFPVREQYSPIIPPTTLILFILV